MPRPISTLLGELQSTLSELAEVLNPLKALTAAFAGKDVPFPMKPTMRRRGPGRKTVARTGVAVAAAAAKTKPATRPKGKEAKATNPNLVFQGKYMSAIRGLSAADKAEVKRVRAEKGVEAAIKVALGKA